MDRWAQVWGRMTATLGAMTVSQRVAVTLCAALIAVSLLWLVQWSASPEMVPLVNQEFTFEELDAAETSLRADGIRHSIRGNRIYVRPGDRHNALRVTHAADALPDGSLYDLHEAVRDASPFQAPEARANAWNFAKGNELAKIIGTSPIVTRASVILNPVTKRRLGREPNVPSASVAITLRPGQELTSEMVEGFAKLVAGAVAGLKPHRVYITDARTGRTLHMPDPENAAAFDVLNLAHRRETQLRKKILENLSHIPGVRVAVTVELDTSKRITQNLRHDSPQPRLERTNIREQSAGQGLAEPGVQANLGTGIVAAGSDRAVTSEEITTEFFDPRLTMSETVEKLPYAVRKITAAVGVPRSFVVSVFRAQHPEYGDDPRDDDPAFISFREAQAASVKAGVERIVQAVDPGDVEVDVFPDFGPVEAGATPYETVLVRHGQEDSEGLSMLRDYLPLAGLTLLAMMSFGLMLWLVRKPPTSGSPRRSAGTDAGYGSEETYVAEEVPVGDLPPGETLLTGKEVDPAALRQTQLSQEIARMVNNDPDGTADLIRRWIGEEE